MNANRARHIRRDRTRTLDRAMGDRGISENCHGTRRDRGRTEMVPLKHDDAIGVGGIILPRGVRVAVRADRHAGDVRIDVKRAWTSISHARGIDREGRRASECGECGRNGKGEEVSVHAEMLASATVEPFTPK